MRVAEGAGTGAQAGFDRSECGVASGESGAMALRRKNGAEYGTDAALSGAVDGESSSTRTRWLWHRPIRWLPQKAQKRKRSPESGSLAFT